MPNATGSKQPRKRYVIILLVAVPILFFLGWSQASLNLSFIQPTSAAETILLLSLSTLIFFAFVIFALILLRILLKLYVEHRKGQLGSAFKIKMVVAFLAMSLVPVCFLFIFASGLINRSIDRWFGIPFNVVRKDAGEIVANLEISAQDRAKHVARHLATNPDLERAVLTGDSQALQLELEREVSDLGFEFAAFYDLNGKVFARAGEDWGSIPGQATDVSKILTSPVPLEGTFTRSKVPGFELFVAAHPVLDANNKALGTIVCATGLPMSIVTTAGEIQRESQKYDQLSQERKAIKRTYLSILWLITLLILFIATWFALFLSKQVTVPIQALAEATHEVSQGNYGYQVAVRATDELGVLINSFNRMTEQLWENRNALEQAAHQLQEANRALEERGNTIEAILESIPTGVISFDPQGQVTRVNSSVERLFGVTRARSARTLSDLFAGEDLRDIARLFRRAARLGVVTRQTEIDAGGRKVVVAVTVSSVKTRHGTVGSVLVVEDLSEVLSAQKALAWQEVAQRIAHEIKNPLTPIQLSTERIRRLIERASAGGPAPDLAGAVAESSELIGREVETLKTLISEFSSYARFPASKPVPSSLNSIIEKALGSLEGRLDKIKVHRQLAADLPQVMADPDQMKRVIVNLVDNSAEAMENSPQQEIWVTTTMEPERDLVEMVVADSGPGITPEAKERLFLPYFSTKRRGTGLGLAIVNRIIAEHHGTIRVEENRPTGTKFVIELPVERVPAEANVA
jgi:two-component system, NtrC family, nitrogen regulation sensor histidine kinase NtrY